MLDALSRPVHVSVTRTTDATNEPITIDEAHDWLWVTDDHDDGTIYALIRAARQKVEDDTGLALMSQTWTQSVDRVPSSQQIVLAVGPVSSVTSVTSYSTSDASSVVATSVYRVDTSSLPARLVLKDGQSWPTGLRPQNAIEVVYVAGHGDSAYDVPEPLLQAMRLLTMHWFSNRSPVDPGGSSSEVPLAYEALIAPYRLRVVM